MNKAVSIILATLMLLSTVACGQVDNNTADSNPEIEETETAAEPSNPNDTPSSEVSAEEVKTFPLEYGKTVETLNDSLEAVGIVLQDPKVSTDDTTEMGKHTAYTFSLGSGASLCIYASDSTQHVLNFTVLTIGSEIDSQTLNNVWYLIGCLEGGLAGDEAERVDAELNMGGSEDTFAMSSTDLAEFMYMMQSGSLVFMVTPA